MLNKVPENYVAGVTPRRRLTALDGLRTIAVLMVFFAHCAPETLPGGFIGVELFFVISGYLITSLLLAERRTTRRISLRRFYIRRALRLYPALLAIVIVVTPIAVLQHIGRPPFDAIAALAYVTNIWTNAFAHLSLLRHTWSLAVEEQFYIVWPLLLIFLLRRRLPVRSILVGLCAVGVLIGYALSDVHIGHHPVIVQYLPTSHLPELAAGILLAFAELPRPSRLLVKLSGLPVVLVTFATLALALFTFAGGWWQYPLATVVCWPLVAHVVIHRDSFVSAALRFKPAVWLGQRSYAVYLWHYPIIVLFELNTSLTEWQIAAIALPMTLIISELSWRFVETPCLRLKNRFEPPQASNGNPPGNPAPAGYSGSDVHPAAPPKESRHVATFAPSMDDGSGVAHVAPTQPGDVRRAWS